MPKKKIDLYTLGEVQHKTGSQRLNIQSLANIIYKTTDDESVKENARKIIDEMDKLTSNLKSDKY